MTLRPHIRPHIGVYTFVRCTLSTLSSMLQGVLDTLGCNTSMDVATYDYWKTKSKQEMHGASPSLPVWA